MCFTAHPYLHSGKCAATFQWQHKTLGFIAETQRSQPAASQRRCWPYDVDMYAFFTVHNTVKNIRT